MRLKIVFISLGFACVLTVLILGNIINLYIVTEKTEGLSEEQIKSLQLQEGKDNNYKKEDLWILVDIDRKYLYLLDTKNNKIIKKYVVATGKSSTPTPTGTYKIIEKAQWGAGFGTRWMRINVPWGQYGIHGTDKPSSIGYNASHGCVRMRNRDIEELYKLVPYGTPVTLYRGQFGPFGHGFRILKPGDRGEDVKEVQKRLKMKGYYYGSLDGIYGYGMKGAVIKFRKDNGLRITHDIDYSFYKALGIELME